MDRKSFIARLIAVPAALMGIRLLSTPSKEVCLFNKKLLQERLDYLNRCPEIQQAQKDLFTYGEAPHTLSELRHYDSTGQGSWMDHTAHSIGK